MEARSDRVLIKRNKLEESADHPEFFVNDVLTSLRSFNCHAKIRDDSCESCLPGWLCGHFTHNA